MLSNPCPEFVELYVAAAKLGVTVVALNTRLHPQEIAYCLGLTEPRIVFAAHDLRELLEPGVEVIGFGGEERGYEELVARGVTAAPAGRPEPEAIHNVLFTSGTTGRPKAAMISQRAAAVRAYRCRPMVRSWPAGRLHRVAAAVSLRRRRAPVRDAALRRPDRHVAAARSRGHVRGRAARAADLDAAVARRDLRVPGPPRAARTTICPASVSRSATPT